MDRQLVVLHHPLALTHEGIDPPVDEEAEAVVLKGARAASLFSGTWSRGAATWACEVCPFASVPSATVSAANLRPSDSRLLSELRELQEARIGTMARLQRAVRRRRTHGENSRARHTTATPGGYRAPSRESDGI